MKLTINPIRSFPLKEWVLFRFELTFSERVGIEESYKLDRETAKNPVNRG